MDDLVKRLDAMADGWLCAGLPDAELPAEAAREIERLREALTELRDRIKGHPAYAELTEEEERDVGGDTADLSYLARVADAALGPNVM